MNIFFDLKNLSSLKITGEIAKKYLQGQLSADLNYVNTEHARPSAICNLKGRIITLCDVIEHHGLQLLINNELKERVTKSLAKTAMLSRVAIENYHPNIIGIYSKNESSIKEYDINLPKQNYEATTSSVYYCYKKGKNRYQLLASDELYQKITKNEKLENDNYWHYLSLLEDKEIIINKATSMLFLPHRLNLHNTMYISFNKGCYKGQEIIARMHYKGKIKHELIVYLVRDYNTISPGDKIIDPETNREIGECIDKAHHNESTIAALSILTDYKDNWPVLEKLGFCEPFDCS